MRRQGTFTRRFSAALSSTPLASGRDADVYAIDPLRVLRRYRNGGDVTAEAAVMAYVAGLGFPVPTVYGARGADLVMERLDGPTMLAALVALLTAFLRHVDGNPVSRLDEALAVRRSDPALTAAEVDRLAAVAARIVQCDGASGRPRPGHG